MARPRPAGAPTYAARVSVQEHPSQPATPDARKRPPGALWPPHAFASRLVRVLPYSVESFLRDHGPQHAAGIAYRALFSIAPLAIVLVSAFSLTLRNEGLRQDVVDRVIELLPVTSGNRATVEQAVTEFASPASAIGLITLPILAWAATGMMAAVRSGLSAMMNMEQSRPMVRGKLVDFALVVAAAVLLFGIVVLTTFGERFGHFLVSVVGLESAVAGLPGRLVTFAILVLVVFLIYRFVPVEPVRAPDALAGAGITAVLSTLIGALSGLAYDRASSLSVIYGPLTAFLVFLYAIYLYSAALMLGAQVTAAWSIELPEGDGASLKEQIRRVIVGLFVSQPQAPPPDSPPATAGTSREDEPAVDR